MHASVKITVHDVVRVTLHDHFFIIINRARLISCNKRRPDISHICTHCLGRQHGTPGGYRAGQQQRPIKPFPNFLHHGKRTFHTCVSTGAGSDADQTISTLFNRLVGKHIVDDVVQYNAAPGLHCPIDILAGAKTGNNDGHFIFLTQLHIVIKPVVAAMHYLIDGKRSSRIVWIFFIVICQCFRDFRQPVFQLRCRPCIQSRHRPHYSRFALFDNQFRITDDKKWRPDNRKWQIL